MMKNTLKIFAAMLMTVSLAVGCVDKKGSASSSDTVAQDEEASTDSTVYGVCGDGTAMHTLQVISDAGDTVDYMINTDGELVSDIQGGRMVGDRMAVIGAKVNQELVAKKVINLTTLLGRWVSLDKNFEIREGGIVESFVKAESHPWTKWKILNGALLLNTDTFEVKTLGADSLLLENKNGIFVYKRQRDKQQ